MLRTRHIHVIASLAIAALAHIFASTAIAGWEVQKITPGYAGNDRPGFFASEFDVDGDLLIAAGTGVLYPYQDMHGRYQFKYHIGFKNNPGPGNNYKEGFFSIDYPNGEKIGLWPSLVRLSGKALLLENVSGPMTASGPTFAPLSTDIEVLEGDRAMGTFHSTGERLARHDGAMTYPVRVLDVEGSMAIVGERTTTGPVNVFQRQRDGWKQVAGLMPPGTDKNYNEFEMGSGWFGEYGAMTTVGDYTMIALGNVVYEMPENSTIELYVFKRGTQAALVNHTALKAPDAGNRWFGTDIRFDGWRLMSKYHIYSLVAETRKDSMQDALDNHTVFRLEETRGSPLSPKIKNGYMIRDADLEGDMAVVGVAVEPDVHTNTSGQGSVHVYAYENDEWKETASPASPKEASPQFGLKVLVDNGRIFVGDRDAGAIYVFRKK